MADEPSMRWFDLVWRLGRLSLARAVHQLDVWRWQLFQSLVCLVLAAVCGLAVLLLMAALAWALFGELHRLEVLSGLLLLYAALGLWFKHRAARWLGVTGGRATRCPMGRQGSAACGPGTCRDAR
jgi:hypothetical protein